MCEYICIIYINFYKKWMVLLNKIIIGYGVIAVNSKTSV